jgi:type II secretory pathway predicted ATPase ExeA
MYESFYGLRERPFDLTPNPRYLVLTAAHREALSSLEYGIASRKGVTLLVGEAGSGKTTVIRTAIERQQSQVHYVHLHNPALTRDEFVEMLAVRFELSPAARESKATLLLELEALLHKRNAAGETTVLVVDEAQSVPLELLEEVRLLANIETNDQKLLSVIMAGQPELAERLNEQSLRQLKQRVALRCELRPLTANETAAYLAGRLIAAGGGPGTQAFTREAVATIHEASKGIPRTISVIADNVLLTAFAAGLRPATRQIVYEVCRDLDLAVNAPASSGPQAPRGQERPPRADQRRGRMLFVEPPAVAAPAASAAPAPAAAASAAAATGDDAGIFGAFFAKRRRFSLF